MLTPSQLQHLLSAAKAACACEVSTGLPAEITVAQWAIESGWGANSPGNNCFGIKAYRGCSATQNLPTVEYIDGVRQNVTCTFASFDSLDACFEKHATLITQGPAYVAAWAKYQQDHDLVRLINGLSRVYATDPEYASKIVEIATMPEVRSAINHARADA